MDIDKIMKKWNFAEHRYEDVENIWDIELIREFGVKTICAHCKKPLLSDDGFVSNQWHSFFGLGYIVCKDCFDTEIVLHDKYKIETKK